MDSNRRPLVSIATVLPTYFFQFIQLTTLIGEKQKVGNGKPINGLYKFHSQCDTITELYKFHSQCDKIWRNIFSFYLVFVKICYAIRQIFVVMLKWPKLSKPCGHLVTLYPIPLPTQTENMNASAEIQITQIIIFYFDISLLEKLDWLPNWLKVLLNKLKLADGHFQNSFVS